MTGLPLTQANLEATLGKLKVAQNDGAITLRPTRMFIPRFPSETDEAYTVRVQLCRDIIANLNKELS